MMLLASARDIPPRSPTARAVALLGVVAWLQERPRAPADCGIYQPTERAGVAVPAAAAEPLTESSPAVATVAQPTVASFRDTPNAPVAVAREVGITGASGLRGTQGRLI